MSVFTYQALRRNGERVNGELQAQSRNEVFRRLGRENLQPIVIEQKSDGTTPVAATGGADGAAPTGPIRLKRSQIIMFTEELSDLLDAGLQLEPALRVMEERSELSKLKLVVTALRQRVREGEDLSMALRHVCPSFGDLYCNLVSAGELAGALPQLLRRQAKHLMEMDELQSRVVQALIYPSVIFLAGVSVMFLFMTFLVPQLMTLFERTGSQLPLMTRMLIDISGFLGSYWWLIIGLVAGLLTLFWQSTSSGPGRLWWDRTKLRLPFFGPVLAARFYAEFSQTLANLVSNGIPLLTALRLMNKANPNTYLHGLVERLTDIVGEGGALSRGMKRTGWFSPLFIDMVAVGEQTGDLGSALQKTASRYERELDVKIQRVTALIPPLVIIMMALLVAVIAYSIITGIFQSIQGIRVRGGG